MYYIVEYWKFLKRGVCVVKGDNQIDARDKVAFAKFNGDVHNNFRGYDMKVVEIKDANFNGLGLLYWNS